MKRSEFNKVLSKLEDGLGVVGVKVQKMSQDDGTVLLSDGVLSNSYVATLVDDNTSIKNVVMGYKNNILNYKDIPAGQFGSAVIINNSMATSAMTELQNVLSIRPTVIKIIDNYSIIAIDKADTALVIRSEQDKNKKDNEQDENKQNEQEEQQKKKIEPDKIEPKADEDVTKKAVDDSANKFDIVSVGKVNVDKASKPEEANTSKKLTDDTPKPKPDDEPSKKLQDTQPKQKDDEPSKKAQDTTQRPKSDEPTKKKTQDVKIKREVDQSKKSSKDKQNDDKNKIKKRILAGVAAAAIAIPAIVAGGIMLTNEDIPGFKSILDNQQKKVENMKNNLELNIDKLFAEDNDTIDYDMLDAIASNPNSDKALQEKAATLGGVKGFAENPTLSDAQIQNLMHGANQDVLSNLAKNPAVDTKYMDSLPLESSPKVASSVLANPNYPQELIQQKIANSPSRQDALSILSNPNINVDIIRQILEMFPDDCEVLTKALANPCLATGDINDLLSKYQNSCASYGASMNPNTSEALLASYAKNNDPAIKYGALSNPSTPKKVLDEKLIKANPKDVINEMSGKSVVPSYNKNELLKKLYQNPAIGKDGVNAIYSKASHEILPALARNKATDKDTLNRLFREAGTKAQKGGFLYDLSKSVVNAVKGDTSAAKKLADQKSAAVNKQQLPIEQGTLDAINKQLADTIKVADVNNLPKSAKNTLKKDIANAYQANMQVPESTINGIVENGAEHNKGNSERLKSDISKDLALSSDIPMSAASSKVDAVFPKLEAVDDKALSGLKDSLNKEMSDMYKKSGEDVADSITDRLADAPKESLSSLAYDAVQSPVDLIASGNRGGTTGSTLVSQASKPNEFMGSLCKVPADIAKSTTKDNISKLNKIIDKNSDSSLKEKKYVMDDL